MATIAYAGNYAGTIVSMPVSGILASTLGWESLFYVFGKKNVLFSFNFDFFFHREFSSTILGTVGCIWYLAWTFIVKGSPEQDKHISKDELRYIQESLGSNRNDVVVHPWKHIFTSKAVYAICASQFAENWGFYTSNSVFFFVFFVFFFNFCHLFSCKILVLTQLPSFLKGNFWIMK